MIARFRYDTRFDPPAAVVPVRVSKPLGEDAVLVPMLVDTGADCTLLPMSTIRQLALPQVEVIALSGIGGARQRSTVHAAAIQLGVLRLLARVVAFTDEAILGRDILNQVLMTLDGPGLTASIAGRSRRRRRSTT